MSALASTSTSAPSQVSPVVQTMHANNAIIDALLGGTKAMRAKGEMYLPKFRLETPEKYRARLARATLYPALKETVSQMLGRVFFEPITTDNVNQTLAPLLENIDLQGNNLDVFAMQVFRSALCYGVSYLLIDYPIAEHIRTRAEEKAQGVRPYWLHILPHQVLGFKSQVIAGKRQLTQFRYQEWLTQEDGEFAEKTVRQIVVLERGRVRKYQETDGSLRLVSDLRPQAAGKILTEIPLVPIYTQQQDFMLGESPLMELAYLNVKHWQSQSDQDNILNTARVPMLWISGANLDGEMEIGESAIRLPEKGQMGYLEHSGAAISAGLESLKELEEQMKVAGAKLLTKTALAMTDSQAKDEQSKEISQLRAMANRFEDALDQALDFTAMWLGLEGGNQVEIAGNIDGDLDPNASMDTVLKLQSAGVLSRQTAFEEAKRRGMISDINQWEDEQARLDSEGLHSEDEEGDFSRASKED